jgi:hypothetical protein
MAAKIRHFGEVEVSGAKQNVYCFHCPGCEYDHPFHVPRWSWNGSMEQPTFRPSLVVWPDRPDKRCHSFVTDGKIQFLSDCYHALKGQTVDLPDWED